MKIFNLIPSPDKLSEPWFCSELDFCAMPGSMRYIVAAAPTMLKVRVKAGTVDKVNLSMPGMTSRVLLVYERLSGTPHILHAP